MLSRSQARAFFVVGTTLSVLSFLLLTADTFARVPGQTRERNLSPAAIRGKHLFDRKNCMGCHTIFGEGAYYAPELTRVYERRGPTFIKAMLRDPEAMYPGQRRMWQYDFTEAEIDDLVAFLAWIGEVDLNGFPPRPPLAAPAPAVATNGAPRPEIFGQLCTACHQLGGQGGTVGPALDDVGSRLTHDRFVVWLRDPAAVKPGTAMPKLPLTEPQIEELAAFLATQKSGGQP
ncbi:MAG: c-type cytochrome [Kofleriaceae bacterium]|nr:MAG: c-type cytochrome [Kofleriaceae bacterium]MBZ0238567.1 c-type cytochrome [Kofleriaceae bacterium]